MAEVSPGGKERSAEDRVKEKLLLTNFHFIFLSNGLFRVFFSLIKKLNVPLYILAKPALVSLWSFMWNFL